MTALRRAIRILRYVNETLVLASEALFPSARAPTTPPAGICARGRRNSPGHRQ